LDQRRIGVMETMEKTSLLQAFVKNWNTTKLPFSAKAIEEAKTFINQAEFPTTRTEAWKYTRLSKLSKQQFTLETAQTATQVEFIDEQATRLVFVNGLYNEALSNRTNVDGLSIELSSETEVLSNEILTDSENIFEAINTLYAQNGVRICVNKNANLTNPIHLVFVQEGENVAQVIRNTFEVADGAKASVVMHLQSGTTANNCFTNMLNTIQVGKQTHFSIYKVQTENASSTFIGTDQVSQERDSYFHIHTTTLNGKLVRNNLNIAVNGENAETNLNGMYLGQGDMHVDNHTVVDHRVANCQSNELYKGVMGDQSTAVFNGKVFVRKDAQKINAFQSNGNVLTSNDASVNSKPELEIYADDVKCSHGSTTGQLDEEAIFYLRARGISEKAARQLMVSAFVGDVMDKIDNEKVHDYVSGKISELFGWEF
jgi:Fe-S cluster assembly protein SufD